MPSFLLVLLISLTAHAEFIESWSVEQSDVEIGWSWADLDGDGIEELIKEDGLTTYFFDGGNFYSLVWSVTDPAPCDSCTFSLFAQSDGIFVFLHQNVYEQSSVLYFYNGSASSPQWTSSLIAGSITRGELEDFDGDGQLDFCYSWHYNNGESWTSAWALRRNNGNLLASGSGLGFLNGPYAGNIEGDSGIECLFNWYLPDGTSTLNCYAWSGTALSPGDRPQSMSIRAYPNPFNPACRLDVPVVAGVDHLSVYSIDGRLVRTIGLQNSLPGKNSQLIWDGLNQQGRPVASGVYIARAGEFQVPITLVR